MGLGRRELEDQQRDNDTATTMLRLMLTASLAAAISAMPAADPQQMIYYYPTTSYVQPQVQYVQQPQVATVAAAEPKTVSYTPTMVTTERGSTLPMATTTAPTAT